MSNPAGNADFAATIFFGALTAPFDLGLASTLGATFAFAFTTGLTTGFADFFATVLATGFATTFLVVVLTAALAGLVTGFVVFATIFVAAFFTAGFAFVSEAFDLAGATLVTEDLIVFPLIGALVALAFALSLGATVFLAAAAEDLAGFKAMRTYSFYEVDRYKISGITKTHVKSAERTGS
jgi:hypothetical protein